MALCDTSLGSMNLVSAQAVKVTVGLASHWPCVTDNSGITTYGLTALGREMSTPPKLQLGVRHTLLFMTVYPAKSAITAIRHTV